MINSAFKSDEIEIIIGNETKLKDNGDKQYIQKQ